MEVSNEVYEAALSNEDYIKIGKSVTRQFKLDNDARLECWLFGLWDALKKYSNKGTKFTTYLYNCVWYRCLKMVCRKEYKYLSLNNLAQRDKQDSIINDVSQLILDRIIGRMSLEELAIKYKSSRHKVKKQLNQELNYLKKSQKVV